MKKIRTSLLCVSMAVLSVAAAAQTGDTPPLREPDYNLPKSFETYPDRFAVDMTALSSLLSATADAPVDVNIAQAGSFRLTGRVMSSGTRNNGATRSVVVRAASFADARIFISRTLLDDGTLLYTGRMLRKGYGDAYELQSAGGQYVFVKRNIYDLVNE